MSWFSATSSTKRASWRDDESFSPPTDWRIEACCGVSAVGTPSASTRTTCGREMPVDVLREAPMRSLLNIPWMSISAAVAAFAKWSEP